MEQTNNNTEYSFNPAPLVELRGANSKTAMARRIGVSRQLYDFYESGGFPSVRVLARMIDEFRLNFSDLVQPVKVPRPSRRSRVEKQPALD